MKILQINSVYKKGSTGKITYDLHQGLLDRNFDSIVCYGRGKKYNDSNIYKVCGELESHIYQAITRINGLIFSSCYRSTKTIMKIIEQEKPDIVHLQCINGYFVNIPKLIKWLKEKNQKTLLTLHAEFMYTGNCGIAGDCNKWKSGCGNCPNLKKETNSILFDRTKTSWEHMRDAFKGFECLRVISVSPWLMNRAKRAPILSDFEHTTVYNGLDTNIFHIYEKNTLNFNIDKKVVFHVTSFFSLDKNHLKGGYYIWEIAKKMPNIQFVIAGEYEQIEQPLENITLLGMIEDQKELAKWYSRASVTIIASKKETFSMVVAESLCCGTPVVGFKAGGPEQIGIPEFCKFVDYSNLGQLEHVLNHFLNLNYTSSEIEQKAQLKYSKVRMIEDYIKEYSLLMGDEI